MIWGKNVARSDEYPVVRRLSFICRKRSDDPDCKMLNLWYSFISENTKHQKTKVSI